MSDISETAPKPDTRTGSLGRVRRVRKAYEQVYDQLQAMILDGDLPQGHRLASEGQLASEFGVSRSTIREALRLLVAEGLIRTAKGAGGGSFVTIPTVDHVSEFLERNLGLLSLTDGLSLEEFLEVRALMEVFAVRRAAMRHTAADLAALRATLTTDASLSAEDQYLQNRQFHVELVEICRNKLLTLSAQPIFFVLHTHLQRSTLESDFPRRVCADHAVILDAIEAGEPDTAELRMREHLSELSKVYARIWQMSGI